MKVAELSVVTSLDSTIISLHKQLQELYQQRADIIGGGSSPKAKGSTRKTRRRSTPTTAISDDLLQSIDLSLQLSRS